MSYFMRPEHQYRQASRATGFFSAGSPRPQAGPRPAASPRQMEARFAGACKACGGRIEAGEQILYSREEGARHLECPAQVALPLAPATVARLEVEDAGVYRLPDGAIVKVQANREKTKVYAKRLVEHKGIDRLTEEGAHVHAEYVYEAGLIAQVSREGVKLTLEEAKALTLRYGFCIRCGRHLTDGRSVEQGMGPVCITYFEGA